MDYLSSLNALFTVEDAASVMDVAAYDEDVEYRIWIWISSKEQKFS